MKRSPSDSRLWQYVGNVLLLALLYVVTGKLGLSLAVPPGYATVLWPPSGIAMGMLVTRGWRLWPGVLLGSFIVNCLISDVIPPTEGIMAVRVLAAFGIAIGSTFQALAGRWLIVRLFGLPLNLRRGQDVLSLLFVAGPIVCIVAVTWGVITLTGTGLMPLEKAAGNWLTWWIGDTTGVLVFLPLVLMAPGNHNLVRWRGRALGALPVMALLAILLSLGLTVYAWKTASTQVYEQAHGEFEALSRDNERALLNRMQAYRLALLGGAGFVRGSQSVSRQEWRTYVQDINPGSNFPGMRGFGFIADVPPGNLAEFERQAREGGAPGFTVHPKSNQKNYVITYIEPVADNRPALGFNIASEAHRLQAAELARDTGNTAVTQRIVLAQDAGQTAGFLLLQPLYKVGRDTSTVTARRAAFAGWAYAPFVAADALKDLTKSQSRTLELSIYDGPEASPDHLIYSSAAGTTTRPAEPEFTVSKSLEVMQQKWFVVWRSTPTFERSKQKDAPLFILISGLVFTGLLGIFFIIITARQGETLHYWAVEDKYLALPVTLFIIVALGSLYLYSQLRLREMAYITSMVEEESRKIDQLITFQTQDKLLSLRRMAQRWEDAGGTPLYQWRHDAGNYTSQLRGLKAVEWIDSNYRVRWVEPMSGAGEGVGTNALQEKKRASRLQQAAQRGVVTISPPLALKRQGEVFIASVPLYVNGKFDGFIAGIFSANELLSSAIAEEISENYAVYLVDEGQKFYSSDSAEGELDSRWSPERTLRVYDRNWTLRVVPTHDFVQSRLTSLPLTVLITGLLIGVLLSVTVRYVLISRIKSLYIENREERLRLLIRHTPAAVAMFDRDLRYIMTSERWVQDYSLQGQEIIGKTHYEVFPEIQSMPHWLDIHQRALRGEAFDGQEESWVRADGRTEWIKWGIHPWYDSQDRIGGIVMFTEVISARKEAEAALMRSNSLNTAILDSAHSLIIATDTQGKIILFNRAAERALGYSADEVVGAENPPLWHDPQEIVQRAAELSAELGEDIEPGLDVFTRRAILEGAESHEWTMIRRDGTRFPVNMTVTPLRGGSNGITGFLGIIEDISERKRQQQSLITSEETFRSAMEHASIGMALVDPSGSWLKVNKALCDLLGYSREELLRTNFQALTHPDDLEQDLEFVRQMLAGEITTYQMEKRYFHRNGRLIWALLSASLVWDANGQPKYFISQIQDITHLKEMERMKNEFVSVVSHELRTPLTSIRGSLGLMAGVMAKDMPESANRLVDIALKNSERLVLLINDILDIDKIASGQMQFDMQPEPVSGLVRQVVDSNRAYADKFGVSIGTILPEPDIQIQVDSTRFIQILTNLLSNAIKFSPPQGAVEVETVRSGPRVRIQVRDHGPGIAEEFRGRIFGKFSQADSSVTRAKGGSGLGLHISRQLTEHMGGNIGFDSIVGEGSIFWVEFPVLEEEPHLEGTTPESAKRVLVCDGNLGVAEHMRSILEPAGFAVDITHTVAEARRLIQDHRYVALTLDIMPPLGEALAFVKQLRTDPDTMELPIIVLSIVPDETQRELNGDAVAVVDWLNKPVDEDQLVRSVQLAVRRKGGIPRILHVEDDTDLSAVLASSLEGQAEIIGAVTLARAEQLLRQQEFSLIILDIGMPDGSGLSLLERLADLAVKPTPVLILSAIETPAEVQRQVAAAMVKCRMPESKIVSTILNLVNGHGESGAASN
jgi:PAS domain S-box-containing protein